MTRTKLAALVLILIVLAALTVFCFEEFTSKDSPALVRVACIGDSITQITQYPSDLQGLLGSKYTVDNFGVSGATAILTSDKPYLFEEELEKAEQFQPTTVIIMLGTNDARGDVYPSIGRFVGDYKQLISQFQSLNVKPQIFLVLPPPVYNNTLGTSGSDLSSGVIPRIEQVANETGLPVIDVHTPLLNHPSDFVDGVHRGGVSGGEI